MTGRKTRALPLSTRIFYNIISVWKRGHKLSHRESSTEDDRQQKARAWRVLGKVIMPRRSRESTIEEKRSMRNQRRKRKRLSRTAKERENGEMRTQKERDAYSWRECIMANGKH